MHGLIMGCWVGKAAPVAYSTNVYNNLKFFLAIQLYVS